MVITVPSRMEIGSAWNHCRGGMVDRLAEKGVAFGQTLDGFKLDLLCLTHQSA